MAHWLTILNPNSYKATETAAKRAPYSTPHLRKYYMSVQDCKSIKTCSYVTVQEYVYVWIHDGKSEAALKHKRHIAMREADESEN